MLIDFVLWVAGVGTGVLGHRLYVRIRAPKPEPEPEPEVPLADCEEGHTWSVWGAKDANSRQWRSCIHCRLEESRAIEHKDPKIERQHKKIDELRESVAETDDIRQQDLANQLAQQLARETAASKNIAALRRTALRKFGE